MSDTVPCYSCGIDVARLESGVQHQHPPRIYELIGSNELPADSERTMCVDLVSGERSRVEELDLHLSRTQSIVDNLFRLREQSQSRLVSLETVLSPSRVLNGDVLSEIFSWTIDENAVTENASIFSKTMTIKETFEQLHNSLNVNRAPWTFLRVSRLWRATCLAFPRLWSQISVQFPPDAIDIDGRLERLKHVLSRSGESSLSVSITSFNDILPSSPYFPLLVALCATAPRWRNLHLQVTRATLTTIQDILPEPHMLELLLVPVNSGVETWTMFSNTPKLHTVWGISKDIAHFQLPWERITEINCAVGVSTSRNSENLALLALLPSLQYCFIQASEDDDVADDQEVITLPLLVRLRIKASTNDTGPHQLLSYLILPALTSLVINGFSASGRENPALGDTLVQLIKRSMAHIRDLRLSSPNLSRDQCLEILHACPELDYLHLQAPHTLTREFFQSLQLDELEENVVPNLRSASFVTGQPAAVEQYIANLKQTRPGLKTTLKVLGNKKGAKGVNAA